MATILWSKVECVYCDRAKVLLSRYGIDFEERKIGDGWNKEDLLKEIPTARSVPQIIFNDEHIGGLPELKAKLDEIFGPVI